MLKSEDVVNDPGLVDTLCVTLSRFGIPAETFRAMPEVLGFKGAGMLCGGPLVEDLRSSKGFSAPGP